MQYNINEVISGCAERNHKYQKIIYEQFRGYALKIVFRYIYRYEKAVDAVNDGFVKLFNHFEKFEPGSQGENEKILMGWLKKIMINTAIDHLRRGNMLPEIGGIPKELWDISDKNDNADQVLMYNELIAIIKALPPSYRIVFNLYVIDGYTHSEIADMLNTTIGTSKSSLSRARQLLQQSIKKMEEAQLCRI